MTSWWSRPSSRQRSARQRNLLAPNQKRRRKTASNNKCPDEYKIYFIALNISWATLTGSAPISTLDDVREVTCRHIFCTRVQRLFLIYFDMFLHWEETTISLVLSTRTVILTLVLIFQPLPRQKQHLTFPRREKQKFLRRPLNPSDVSVHMWSFWLWLIVTFTAQWQSNGFI